MENIEETQAYDFWILYDSEFTRERELVENISEELWEWETQKIINVFNDFAKTKKEEINNYYSDEENIWKYKKIEEIRWLKSFYEELWKLSIKRSKRQDNEISSILNWILNSLIVKKENEITDNQREELQKETEEKANEIMESNIEKVNCKLTQEELDFIQKDIIKTKFKVEDIIKLYINLLKIYIKWFNNEKKLIFKDWGESKDNKIDLNINPVNDINYKNQKTDKGITTLIKEEREEFINSLYSSEIQKFGQEKADANLVKREKRNQKYIEDKLRRILSQITWKKTTNSLISKTFISDKKLKQITDDIKNLNFDWLWIDVKENQGDERKTYELNIYMEDYKKEEKNIKRKK